MLAVVGAGRWGSNHVRNFAALGALRAICDTSREALDRISQTFPGLTIYPDLADLLADRSIRAVVIATPAELHFAQAKAALAAGRHVLVEKPMAFSLADAESLDCMATDQRLVLMVGHLLEYHPAFLRLSELVLAGELGGIIRVQSRRLIPGVSGHQESVLWDLGPHDLAMILRLVGALPGSVQASGTSTGQVDDAVTLNLTFPGAVGARVSLSWTDPVKEQLLVVMGTCKTAEFDDTAKEGKLRLYQGSAGSSLPDSRAQLIPYPSDEPLRRECEHFLNCIETGGRPLTDSASGVRVTRVLDACERSLRAGGVAVTVGRG